MKTRKIISLITLNILLISSLISQEITFFWPNEDGGLKVEKGTLDENVKERCESYDSLSDFKSITFSPTNGTITFTDREIEYLSDKSTFWNNTYSYERSKKNGLPYLTITKEGFSKTFLLLKNNEIVSLYEKDSSVPFFIGCKNNIKSEGLFSIDGNNEKLTLDNPYIFTDSLTININCKKLYFINGYVSLKYPDMWKTYSRIKDIEVILLDKGTKYTYSLKDSPHIQSLDFLEGYKGKIKINVLDTYKGEKEDCAITSFLCNLWG